MYHIELIKFSLVRSLAKYVYEIFLFVSSSNGVSERNLDRPTAATICILINGLRSSAGANIQQRLKTKEDITGFSLNKRAVKRWISSQSQRGSITRQCHTLAGIKTTDRFVLAVNSIFKR